MKTFHRTCLCTLFFSIFLCLAISGCQDEPIQVQTETGEVLPNIRIAIASSLTDTQAGALISKEVSRLCEERYGCRAELIWSSESSENDYAYYAKDGTGIDIFSFYFDTFSSFAEKGLLLDMKDYLSEWGPSLQSVLDEKAPLLNTGQGQVYGIPKPLSDIHTSGALVSREYAEKYQFDLSKIKTPEDLEPMLAVIAKEEPDVIPWAAEKRASPIIGRIPIGDVLDNTLSVIAFEDESHTVKNLYETKAYENRIRMARRWYQNGYVRDDILTQSENGKNMVIAGDAFATEFVVRPDEQELLESLYGDKVAVVPFDSSPVITTNCDWVTVWSIASQTSYPKEAVRVLNALYEDEDLITLILYGIKDVHYVALEDGSITFPPGVSPENAIYRHGSMWRFDTRKGKPWSGVSPDLEKKMDAFHDQATVSQAYGFWFDEAAANVNLKKLRDIISNYALKLECGLLDPDRYLHRFREELRKAGSARLVKEVQQQLDEYW